MKGHCDRPTYAIDVVFQSFSVTSDHSLGHLAVGLILEKKSCFFYGLFFLPHEKKMFVRYCFTPCLSVCLSVCLFVLKISPERLGGMGPILVCVYMTTTP